MRGLALALFVLCASPVGAQTRAMTAGYAVLSGIDLAQSMHGIGAGTVREANPFLRPLASHPAVYGGVKAAATFAVCYGIEALRRKHKRTAMIAAAGAVLLQGAVVVHNQRQRAGR